MRVLVTGGTGFTGSHTVCALIAAGHQVRLLVRDAAKVRRVFESRGFVPDDVTVGDMTDADAVDDALTGCDGVVHAAALVDLRRSMARAVEDTNTRGVELVIGGAAKRGLSSIVYVSSLGVFFVPGGPPLTPELPIAPGTTAYARSKAQAERYVRRLQQDGAPIRICYPAGIMGPDDPGLSAVSNGLVSFMRDIFVITSGGMQIVDVRDLAALHVKLARAARWRAPIPGQCPNAFVARSLSALLRPHRAADSAHRRAWGASARSGFRGRRGEACPRLRLPIDPRRYGIHHALAGRRCGANHP